MPVSSAVSRAADRFEVAQAGELGAVLVARVQFRPREILTDFRAAALLSQPTRHSIQLSITEHGLVDPEFLRYMHHGCEPNVVLETDRLLVRAVRPIAPGDQITFFYPSTEWSMAAPFQCACGSSQCLGTITGAALLPDEVLARYELSAHVRMLLQARRAAASPVKVSQLMTAAGEGEVPFAR